MKIDGRTLDHSTLEQIRLMAIRRMREGEDPGVVIASHGFNRTTIYKWMRMAAGSGNGLRALGSTRGTGRPRSLTLAQERQVFRCVNGRDPRQYGLDFGLWTRAIVALLIEKKFGVNLGVTAIGSLLAKLELTPQKPLQRAYQRDPDAIALWQRQTYPALAREAKRDGAQILFWSVTDRPTSSSRCSGRPHNRALVEVRNFEGMPVPVSDSVDGAVAPAIVSVAGVKRFFANQAQCRAISGTSPLVAPPGIP